MKHQLALNELANRVGKSGTPSGDSNETKHLETQIQVLQQQNLANQQANKEFQKSINDQLMAIDLSFKRFGQELERVVKDTDAKISILENEKIKRIESNLDRVSRIQGQAP